MEEKSNSIHITKSTHYALLTSQSLSISSLSTTLLHLEGSNWSKAVWFPVPHSTCSYSAPLSHTRKIRIPFRNSCPGLHAFSFLTIKQNGFFFFFFFTITLPLNRWKILFFFFSFSFFDEILFFIERNYRFVK